MEALKIFIFVYVAMVAMSFWESSVEGKEAGDRGKFGWKMNLGKYHLTSYHFFLFVIMWPALLSLPLVIFGWDTKLFGILLSAYTSGMIIEDFMWFVVNPVLDFSKFNPNFVNYYPWIIIGKVKIPLLYVLGILISFLSWFFLWK